jgi:hypothetical protein
MRRRPSRELPVAPNRIWRDTKLKNCYDEGFCGAGPDGRRRMSKFAAIIDRLAKDRISGQEAERLTAEGPPVYFLDPKLSGAGKKAPLVFVVTTLDASAKLK